MNFAAEAKNQHNTALISNDMTGPIRVLVVDDSAVTRGLLSRWLEADSKIYVTGTAANGLIAIEIVNLHDIEVVILDVEMPQMDGLTALPKLIMLKPNIQILMASTVTLHNAEVSLQALKLGAADYIAKPTGIRLANANQNFKSSLVDKVVALGERHRRLQAKKPSRLNENNSPQVAVESNRAKSTELLSHIKFHPLSNITPRVLAIGSSTGGPQALFELIGSLPKPFPIPILITQHMPPTFTAMLAQHITRLTGIVAAEGQHDDLVVANRIYVAPGDRHMFVKIDEAGQKRIVISDDQPENFCKPSVDPLFRSVARVYGDSALCLVLTGMGADGSRSSLDIIQVGGSVIVQDEESSVVWGMPGAVIQAGNACCIASIPEMGNIISKLLNEKML